MNTVDNVPSKEQVADALERDLKLLSAILHVMRCDKNIFDAVVTAMHDKYTLNPEANEQR